jgi:hypothetical protein
MLKHNAAYEEALRVEAHLKRLGYKDAAAAPQYCIGPEISEDRFYTYNVSVYAGKRTEVPKKPWWRFWS